MSALSISPELFALTVSAIIGGIVAVIATFSIQYYFEKPKVKGNIVIFVSAGMIGNFPDVRGQINSTLVFPYVILTNQHKNPVSMIDFILEADYGEGWHGVEPMMEGPQTNALLQEKMVIEAGNRIVSFPNLDKALLFRKLKPIGFGDYYEGFLLFATRTPFPKPVNRLKLTCVDVFLNKHVIYFPLKLSIPKRIVKKLKRKKEEEYVVPFYIFLRNAEAKIAYKKS